MTKQQRPPSTFVTLQTGLASRTCHRVSVLDVLLALGWGHNIARATIQGSHVSDFVLVDFLGGPRDSYALRIGNYVVSFVARPETTLDRIRYWFLGLPWVRYRSFKWLLPKLGGLRCP